MVGRNPRRAVRLPVDVGRRFQQCSLARLGRDFSRRRDQHFSYLDDTGLAWRSNHSLRDCHSTNAHVGLAHQRDRRTN